MISEINLISCRINILPERCSTGHALNIQVLFERIVGEIVVKSNIHNDSRQAALGGRPAGGRAGASAGDE